MRQSGKISIAAMALEALHHGAGTEGNTQVLRRQEVVTPGGEISLVPFISGNSIRHMLRDAGVRYALDAMGVADGCMSKGMVDLLFSGGSLGGKTTVTMQRARRVADLFPLLSVLGYSAGTRIQPGKIEVQHLHLVCSENAHRMPPSDHEPALLRQAGSYTGEEFGTRHDVARLPYAQRLLGAPKPVAEDAAKPRTKQPKDDDSTQMIFDWETILPGAQFWGGMTYRDLSERELDALRSALSYACEGMHADGGYLFRVGAKRGAGHGLMSWRLSGSVRSVSAPASTPSDAMLPSITAKDDAAGGSLSAYAESLRAGASEILRELEEIAA